MLKSMRDDDNKITQSAVYLCDRVTRAGRPEKRSYPLWNDEMTRYFKTMMENDINVSVWHVLTHRLTAIQVVNGILPLVLTETFTSRVISQAPDSVSLMSDISSAYALPPLA
eukprot:PhF_6_TR33458/c1_g1_i2/m.48804